MTLTDRWARNGPQWTEIAGSFTEPDGTTFSPSAPAKRSPEERAARGWARIEDPGAATPPGHVVFDSALVDVGGVPTIVYSYRPIPVDVLAAQMLAEVRTIREGKEVAGILFNGTIPIRTDEKSQAKVAGALVGMGLAGATQIDSFEALPGVFVVLTREQLEGVGAAIFLHIQACFSRSEALTVAIRAADTLADLLAIDLSNGWPATLT